MLNLFKKYFHSLQESNECDYKAYVGMKKDAKNVVTDLSGNVISPMNWSQNQPKSPTNPFIRHS